MEENFDTERTGSGPGQQAASYPGTELAVMLEVVLIPRTTPRYVLQLAVESLCRPEFHHNQLLEFRSVSSSSAHVRRHSPPCWNRWNASRANSAAEQDEGIAYGFEEPNSKPLCSRRGEEVTLAGLRYLGRTD
jgi:hypothetical protein